MITAERLQSLCVKHNWFTCGSNNQYEKLFEIGEDPSTSPEMLATLIWFCSDNVNYGDVLKVIYNELKGGESDAR